MNKRQDNCKAFITGLRTSVVKCQAVVCCCCISVIVAAIIVAAKTATTEMTATSTLLHQRHC
ncbi:MAG: hypothetical protein M3261_07110, partial [Thermoproteota archaeon]|nr:hypothetical protein [Thermoproteota archaeon]